MQHTTEEKQKREFYEAGLQRQWDIIPMDALEMPITVIGAGAIGGWVVLSLAKMGCRDITVFDFDEIEVENLGTQFYRHSDIGKKKVEALAELVEAFTGYRPRVVADRYTGDRAFPGIVISAVDSMAARKLVFETHRFQPESWFIDPRMGAETALCYAFRCSDDSGYEKALYTDEQAVQERCTAKATIYTANLLAGHVCATVKAILTGQPFPPTMQWDVPTFQLLAWMPPKETAKNLH